MDTDNSQYYETIVGQSHKGADSSDNTFYIGLGVASTILLLSLVGMGCMLIEILQEYIRYRQQTITAQQTLTPVKITPEFIDDEVEDDFSELTITNEWSELLMGLNNNIVNTSP